MELKQISNRINFKAEIVVGVECRAFERPELGVQTSRVRVRNPGWPRSRRSKGRKWASKRRGCCFVTSLNREANVQTPGVGRLNVWGSGVIVNI